MAGALETMESIRSIGITATLVVALIVLTFRLLYYSRIDRKEERAAFQAVVEKMSCKAQDAVSEVEASSQYIKQEHDEQLEVLSRIHDQVTASIATNRQSHDQQTAVLQEMVQTLKEINRRNGA